MNKYEAHMLQKPIPLRRFTIDPLIPIVGWVPYPQDLGVGEEIEYPVIRAEIAEIYAGLLPGLRNIHRRLQWIRQFEPDQYICVAPDGLHLIPGG